MDLVFRQASSGKQPHQVRKKDDPYCQWSEYPHKPEPDREQLQSRIAMAHLIFDLDPAPEPSGEKRDTDSAERQQDIRRYIIGEAEETDSEDLLVAPDPETQSCGYAETKSERSHHYSRF